MPDFSIITQTPDIRALVQENVLERAFHDSLYPRLLYRADVMAQLFAGNIGDTPVFTGAGLVKPKMQPLVPGSDPVPSTYTNEQWTAQIQQYADSIDTHMPTSTVAIANLFYRNAQQLGLSAGQSLNRLVRNAMFRAGLSGQTVMEGAQGPGNTFRIARLNGLTRARRPDLPAGSAVKFDFVSASNPLQVIVDTTVPSTVSRNIVSFAADNPGDETGPGTVTLDGAAISVFDRGRIESLDKTSLVRVGGGLTVDGVSTVNNLRLSDVRSAVSRFRLENAPAHPDGKYHCHLDPFSESQIYNDPEWQRLLTSLPDYYMYQEFAIGQLLGCAFFRNSESPLSETVTGSSTSFVVPSLSYSLQDPFPGEVVNASGVAIHRALFSAQGGIYEYYMDLSSLLTEAGITGKVGEWSITNNSIEVYTDRLGLIIRAPLNRLQDQVSTSWKFIGDWPLRTDAAAGDAARYKRFVVVEHG